MLRVAQSRVEGRQAHHKWRLKLLFRSFLPRRCKNLIEDYVDRVIRRWFCPFLISRESRNKVLAEGEVLILSESEEEGSRTK